jgi:hypothetical protein
MQDDRKWNERSTLGYTVRSICDYQNRNDGCEAKKEGVRSISAVTRYSGLLAEFVLEIRPPKIKSDYYGHNDLRIICRDLHERCARQPTTDRARAGVYQFRYVLHQALLSQ